MYIHESGPVDRPSIVFLHGNGANGTIFQAIDFYLNRGYTLFGELEGKPAGSTWY